MRKLIAALCLSLPLAGFADSTQTAVLDVQNMTCSMCTVTIRRALEKTPGVIQAKVDYDQKTASVTYNPAKTNAAALMRVTTDAGFPSIVHRGSKQ